MCPVFIFLKKRSLKFCWAKTSSSCSTYEWQIAPIKGCERRGGRGSQTKSLLNTKCAPRPSPPTSAANESQLRTSPSRVVSGRTAGARRRLGVCVASTRNRVAPFHVILLLRHLLFSRSRGSSVSPAFDAAVVLGSGGGLGAGLRCCWSGSRGRRGGGAQASVCLSSRGAGSQPEAK